MKTLVLSGFFGFDNAGDEAILISLVQKLKHKGYRPLVLSANPEKTKALYGVDAIHRMKLKEIISAIRSSDGLISGGGSLLQDSTSVRNSIYYLGIMQMALLFRKPVFMYAQGVGPLRRKWLQRLTGFLLNRIQYRSVRDVESKKLLMHCGVKKPIDVTVDPVLGFETTPVQFSESFEEFLLNKPIVFSLRSWENHDSMVNYYREVIKSLNERGIPVILIPFHHPDDIDFSKKIASTIENPLLSVAEKLLSIDEMLTIIKNSRLVFGVRLHSLIFAANQEVPFVGLSYDPKIDSFLSLYDKKPIASTDNFDCHSTLLSIFETLDSSEKEKEKISKKQKEIIEQLQLPLVAIDKHFLGG